MGFFLRILLACFLFLALVGSGCVSEQLLPLPEDSLSQEICRKNSLGNFPYWFECNGKKVSQSVLNASAKIENFSVFPGEQRAFWEYSDSKGLNFYSNNFSANSLTLLNIKANRDAREYIERFSAGNKNFLEILKESKRLLYKLVKKDALYETVSERIFSTNLFGDPAKELTQEQKRLQNIECLNVENNKLFWFFSKKDLNGNEIKALYYNTLDGQGFKLASYVAKPCNPKQPALKSNEIRPFEKICGENAFYSKGDFVFWVFQDTWNSNGCNGQNIIESVFATHMPGGTIKNLTQFSETSSGDYLDVFQAGIDLKGNRFVWIYYSKDSREALYYNCLKGSGIPRVIDGSMGNVSREITIEENTISWKANSKDFNAQLQECPN